MAAGPTGLWVVDLTRNLLFHPAATGAALLFTGAVITRLRRGEQLTIVVDLVYLALAVFVAWGRFGPESFHG